MICLCCGECCRTMSPLEADGVPCRHLLPSKKCAIYETRPNECINHMYPADVCPIGIEETEEKRS